MIDGAILGVDGGGTRTVAIAAGSRGKVLHRASGASINYYSIGMTQARRNFRDLLRKFAGDAGISRFQGAFIGTSALDREADAALVDAFSGDALPGTRVMMNSDAYIALFGACGRRPGCIMISGTGSMGMARNGDGLTRTVGGWGYLLGDGGSAYHIALDALRACLDSFDGVEAPTGLQGDALAYFGVEDPKELIDLFYTETVSRMFLAGFAIAVDARARSGDAAAQSILDRAVDDLFRQARVLLDFVGDEISLAAVSGGVFRNSERVRTGFLRKAQEYRSGIAVGFPEHTPEAGAVMAAMDGMGMTIDAEVLDNLRFGSLESREEKP